MRRRLFNLAAASSLVLCAGAMALWVLSYTGVGTIYVPALGRDRTLEFRRGTASLCGDRTSVTNPDGTARGAATVFVQFPWWPVVVANSGLPAWWTVRQWRASSIQAGSMPHLRLRPPRHARPLP